MFSASLQLPKSIMDTTELPPGIYRIALVRFGGVEPALLTRQGGNRVTILPPGAQADPEQEVMRRCLTGPIDCRSPALLVANQPWSKGPHDHRAPLQDHTNFLPYLQRRSRGAQGRRRGRGPSF